MMKHSPESKKKKRQNLFKRNEHTLREMVKSIEYAKDSLLEFEPMVSHHSTPLLPRNTKYLL